MDRTPQQFKSIQHIRQVRSIKETANKKQYPLANEREILAIEVLAQKLELALGHAAKLGPGERDGQD